MGGSGQCFLTTISSNVAIWLANLSLSRQRVTQWSRTEIVVDIVVRHKSFTRLRLMSRQHLTAVMTNIIVDKSSDSAEPMSTTNDQSPNN